MMDLQEHGGSPSFVAKLSFLKQILLEIRSQCETINKIRRVGDGHTNKKTSTFFSIFLQEKRQLFLHQNHYKVQIGIQNFGTKTSYTASKKSLFFRKKKYRCQKSLHMAKMYVFRKIRSRPTNKCKTALEQEFRLVASAYFLIKRQFHKAILCSKRFEIPLRERQFRNVLFLQNRLTKLPFDKAKSGCDGPKCYIKSRANQVRQNKYL